MSEYSEKIKTAKANLCTEFMDLIKTVDQCYNLNTPEQTDRIDAGFVAAFYQKYTELFYHYGNQRPLINYFIETTSYAVEHMGLVYRFKVREEETEGIR